MARTRKTRGPVAAAAPLRKTPTAGRGTDSAELLHELAAVYAAVGARGMPDNLLGALQYAERHQARVADPKSGLPAEAARNAALTRVRLWEHLRQQTLELVDRHQVRAVNAARTAGAEWADLAEPLAVGAASSAVTKAKRMRSVDLRDEAGRRLRRTPEAVDAVLARQAEQTASALRREAAEQRRHALVTRVATNLLAHRTELSADEEVAYWLDQTATVLADCRTTTQVVSLATYVEAALRHLQRHEQRTGEPAAVTAGAVAAYEAARVLAQGGGTVPD
ncbi:hypothetical protein [Streptomyces marianii]|uniref:Uncharacterized protein n=1 Tax=Streptomyces marianii TaxID=1817406 RepID=A0A5R9DSH9_9ACTN|nr:hypothetical protein [Streptomyces marianii]TLQ38955.1 hypothetical protein FEF34_39740 [Streptomyces marianii]